MDELPTMIKMREGSGSAMTELGSRGDSDEERGWRPELHSNGEGGWTIGWGEEAEMAEVRRRSEGSAGGGTSEMKGLDRWSRGWRRRDGPGRR